MRVITCLHPVLKVKDNSTCIFTASLCPHGLKIKGKVHPCSGTEALYRPYGP